ncbi:MAG: hypothetical protein LBQ33_06165 [Oscillospiraceae bacterium]|jgi:hypothetical protein|nr:hypothetical protein [Oscillospiraceae bacterium]
MEAYVRDQILAAVRHVPFHILASFCKKKSSPEAEQVRRRAGGFIKGVCHPEERFDELKGCGMEWVRYDIPFPFEADGSIRQSYVEFKKTLAGYVERGFRFLGVTPFPRDYIQFGVDPRKPENEARVREIAVFLINDLRGLIHAVQVTNEMGVPRFTLPLTMEEAARFIGIHLAAMYPHRGDILLGYNSAGPQADLHQKMKPWLQYCDYVGIDIYIGCFVSLGNWIQMYDLLLRYLWSFTGKPILLCEFGYISGGAPKTAEEKRAVLQRYGVNSEAEARADIKNFVERLNPDMKNQVKDNASGDWGDFLFQLDFCNHFYSEMPKGTVIRKYPHTPEGQADFYRDIFPRLAKLPFVVGAVVYCFSDSDKCYVCGQPDCPTETRWGLLTTGREKKPSYYAVRDALAEIK